MDITGMPSSAPLIRAMEWSITKKYLPLSLSNQLPDGDPLYNQKEIHNVSQLPHPTSLTLMSSLDGGWGLHGVREDLF
jgi:hypothetical protein